MQNAFKYYLGSNTEQGFKSYFYEILKEEADATLYVIKGGPGSGKSSLMKKLKDKFLQDGDIVETFSCSSDAYSLDGVVSLNKKIAAIDGTSPHIIEPKYPGAYEIIINTAEGFDIKMLKENFADIKRLQNEIQAHHDKATEYIKEAAVIRKESQKTAEKYLNKDLIFTMAQMLPIKNRFKKKGDKKTRLLSAVSVGETRFMNETVSSFGLIYAIKDQYGAAADLLIKSIEKIAEEEKESRILCPCAIMPKKLEHIAFYDADMIFITENSFHKYQGKNAQVLDGFYMPFSKNDLINLEKQTAMASYLIKKAEHQVIFAKVKHDELENIYKKAMDYSILDKFYKKIINNA